MVKLLSMINNLCKTNNWLTNIITFCVCVRYNNIRKYIYLDNIQHWCALIYNNCDVSALVLSINKYKRQKYFLVISLNYYKRAYCCHFSRCYGFHAYRFEFDELITVHIYVSFFFFLFSTLWLTHMRKRASLRQLQM